MITPNPADNYVLISFYAEKDCEVVIRLIDKAGKLVFRQNQKVSRGNNTMQLTGLKKYSNGVYEMQLFADDKVTTQKLVLIK